MHTIEEIKIHMKANKITQIQLAEMSNIPLGSLRNIFSGRVPHPRSDTMQAIENALGLNEKATEYSAATTKIITDLQKAGLTEERYATMTEEQRQDFLQMVKILTKKSD